MTDQELRGLVERAHQIRELTQTPAFQLLADYVQAQLAAKQRSLLSGAHDDLLRYKYEAGWVQGAAFVLSAPDRLDEQIEREREIRKEQAEAA